MRNTRTFSEQESWRKLCCINQYSVLIEDDVCDYDKNKNLHSIAKVLIKDIWTTVETDDVIELHSEST